MYTGAVGWCGVVAVLGTLLMVAAFCVEKLSFLLLGVVMLVVGALTGVVLERRSWNAPGNCVGKMTWLLEDGTRVGIVGHGGHGQPIVEVCRGAQ